jgi:hypothetical protein
MVGCFNISETWLVSGTEVDEYGLFGVVKEWCVAIGVYIQLHVWLWLAARSEEVVLHANIIIELPMVSAPNEGIFKYNTLYQKNG